MYFQMVWISFQKKRKKIFDKVMHIKRLEEEVMILATEVRQHWEFLKKRKQTLSGRSVSQYFSNIHYVEQIFRTLSVSVLQDEMCYLQYNTAR